LWYNFSFQENSETVEGGWKTESMLLLQPGWDSLGAYCTMLLFASFQVMYPCRLQDVSSLRTMVKSAISWATQRGLNRHNPVHGKEEYRIATDWNFKSMDKDTTQTRVSGNFEVQAGPALGSSVMLLLHIGLWSMLLVAGRERHPAWGECQPHCWETDADTCVAFNNIIFNSLLKYLQVLCHLWLPKERIQLPKQWFGNG
jgi:hypothetical protein